MSAAVEYPQMTKDVYVIIYYSTWYKGHPKCVLCPFMVGIMAHSTTAAYLIIHGWTPLSQHTSLSHDSPMDQHSCAYPSVKVSMDITVAMAIHDHL